MLFSTISGTDACLNTYSFFNSLLDDPDGVSFIIPKSRGDYVIGLGRSLAFLDWNTATVQKLVEVEQGTKNRFNDAKCDASGRLWAGKIIF